MDINSRLYGGGGSDFIGLLDNSSNSLWVPSSSSSSFHETMVNFNQDPLPRKRPNPNPNPDPDPLGDETGGEEFEINPFHHQEKKRRLSPEQVALLEKSFEEENKLEPERKAQLAKELGLEPRQVAIWFQNRRARFKTKQLEKDYDSLKAKYDRLKASFDGLIKERNDLQNEVKLLTKKLKQQDSGRINSDPNNSDDPLQPNPDHQEMPEENVDKNAPKRKILGLSSASNKLQVIEEASSAKSDVFDSDSPHCTESNQYSSLYLDSTRVPDPDLQSDSSPDDEEGHLINMGQTLMFPPTPPALFNNGLIKVGDNEYYDPNVATYSSFSQVDEQHVWSWLY